MDSADMTDAEVIDAFHEGLESAVDKVCAKLGIAGSVHRRCDLYVGMFEAVLVEHGKDTETP
jgi:hypothetical protein